MSKTNTADFTKFGTPNLSKTVTNMAQKRGLEIEIFTDEDSGEAVLWILPTNDFCDATFVTYEAAYNFDYEDETADFRGWKLCGHVDALEDVPAFILGNKTELYAKELIKYAAKPALPKFQSEYAKELEFAAKRDAWL